MPRSRSRSAPRPAPRPAPAPTSPPRTQSFHTQAPPPPAPHHAPPPPAMPQQGGGGGLMAGLAGTVAQGMALGTGSALAHRAVDAVLGSRHPEPAAATAAAQELVAERAPCSDQAKAFADCMSFHSGDMGACDEYFQRMQACRRALQ